MTEFLTTEDLLALAHDLGVGLVRDLGLLESAAHRPTTSLWGQEAYPSLELKAAALMDSLVNNHPLVDGNKRLGWLAALVFLDVNGVWIEAPDDDAYQLVIDVASGKVELAHLAQVLSSWSMQGGATGVGSG